MRRREFITVVGGAATWPFATRAQPGRVPTVGFLGAGTVSSWSLWTAAFIQRMRELGWIDGRTIAIEYRWAEGRSERYTEIGAEFVRLKVDVIVTVGTAIPALKQLTSVIPIIFAAALDPVGSGLVASLARPGGNVTGLSIQSTELVTKRIEFLRELLRDLRRVAVMGNQGYSAVLLEMREVEAAARTLGLEIDIAEVGRAEDISPTFDKFTSRVQALYVCPDALMNANSVPINTLALGAHLPTMFATRSPFVEGVARPQFGFIGNKQSQHRPQQAKATCDNCTTIWVIHKHKRQLNPGSRIFPSSNIGVYGFFTWRKPIPIINPRIWANRNAVDLTDVSSNSSISISTSTGISISRHQRDIRDGIVVNSRYVPLRWTGRLIYMYRA